MPEFRYHSALKKVVMQEGVQGIQPMAFLLCTDLETVVIPKSIKHINGSAFLYCPNLKTIEFNGTVEEWRAVSKDKNWYTECPIEKIICLDGEASPTEQPSENETVTIWVSPTHGVKEFTEEQINSFLEMHPEYSNYNIIIQTVGEGSAASTILKDLSKAPDIYCFAQNQLDSLVKAGALDSLSNYASLEAVINNNDIGSVNAASVNNTVYAYPLTSDNGCYLYYDASVVSDEEAQTLEGIIAACERSGKKFGYKLSDGWFMASFFFSQPVGSSEPLCVSKWTFSENGNYATGVNDTFNSENGIIAMKAMRKLASSDAWLDNSDNFSNTGAVVSGIWNAETAKKYYGNNLRAVKLPTFTVDGQEYQLGSFAGYKLMGVKPQSDPKKSAFLHKLAYYLTNEESQLARYQEFYWGPSNKNVQAHEDVKNNMCLSALLSQNVYAQPQGNIPSDWWSEASYLGVKASQNNITDDELKQALESYEERIKQMLTQ